MFTRIPIPAVLLIRRSAPSISGAIVIVLMIPSNPSVNSPELFVTRGHERDGIQGAGHDRIEERPLEMDPKDAGCGRMTGSPVSG